MIRARLVLAFLFVCSLGCTSSEEATTAPADESGGSTTGTPDPNELDETPDPTQEGALTYYRDVKPLLDTMCVRCHSEGGIREQVPLVEYDDVKNLAPLIKDKVASREMPPWRADHGCRDYAFDESLTETEIATITEWADTGAASGSVDAEPVAVAPRTFATLSREDVTLPMPVDYIMKQSPDEYRCFLIDWPETEPTFITGFGARPGNPAVVHHVIAYLVPPGQVATFQGYDDDDEGPGYSCFGGPSGSNATGGGAAVSGIKFLGGWAPGGVGSDFPPGTGMPVEPGSKVALQLHYNTLDTEPQPDRTSVVFKTDTEVEREALVMPWTNFKWVLGQGMEIPAGEEGVTHRYSGDPWDLPFVAGGGVSSNAMEIHSATLHMHVLGTSGSVFVERAAGEEECLLNVSDYDFGWQRSYGFMKPVVVRPGDKLGLECQWDNSQKNQQWIGNVQMEPVDQSWGEGTVDEMCVAFFYVVPITDNEP